MSALKELARCVAALLRDDPRRCLLGEDVRNGGLLGLSRAAIERDELRTRVFGAPLTCGGQLAHAGGLALAGQRPIVLLPSAAALLEGLASLRELGRIGWRSAGQSAIPLLCVAPNGPGFGVGGEGSESVEASLAAVPGVEVWTVGRAQDLVAALDQAATFDEPGGEASGPRVLLLPRGVVVHELIEELDDAVELGPTRVLRAGTQATVFAWGEALEPALAAAEACARASEDPNARVEVSVVELARLAPLDLPRLVELANATGKLVIAHAGPRRGGPGAELAAAFADRSILHLDAPVVRVTGELDGLAARHEEHRAAPSASAIAEAITQVVHY